MCRHGLSNTCKYGHNWVLTPQNSDVAVFAYYDYMSGITLTD